MVSPLYLSDHPADESGVTVLLPQPQQHRCMTVAYSIDTYRVPDSRSEGMSSTKRVLTDSTRISFFA